MPSGYWAAARHVHAAWQTRAAMSSGTASVSSTRLCRILKATACVKSCCMPASTSSPARASSNSGTTHTLPRPPTRQRTVHLVNLVSPGKKTFVCPRCHSVTTPRRAERSLELGDALHARIERRAEKKGKEDRARKTGGGHVAHTLHIVFFFFFSAPCCGRPRAQRSPYLSVSESCHFEVGAYTSQCHPLNRPCHPVGGTIFAVHAEPEG